MLKDRWMDSSDGRMRMKLKQVLDDLEENRGYLKLKEKALYPSLEK
jgi:hypothetical protein